MYHQLGYVWTILRELKKTESWSYRVQFNLRARRDQRGGAIVGSNTARQLAEDEGVEGQQSCDGPPGFQQQANPQR